MSAEQLCLFKFPRPLVERFGDSFFKALPSEPGVYLFVGDRRRVLYVGQSKNLRNRLAFYKNAQPEREPRKIIRLVHQTEEIQVERCLSAEAAQVRELELIHQHRPSFNVAHTLSRTYTSFGLRSEPHGIICRTTINPEHENSTEELFGAFRNRGLCRRVLFSIGRLIWAAEQRPRSLFDLPIWLNDRSRTNLLDLRCQAAETVAAELKDFFMAKCSRFVQRCEALACEENDPFLRRIFELDRETLTEFGAVSAQLRDLREFHRRSGVVPQCELDRMTIQMRFEQRAQRRGHTAVDRLPEQGKISS